MLKPSDTRLRFFLIVNRLFRNASFQLAYVLVGFEFRVEDMIRYSVKGMFARRDCPVD